MNSQQIQAYAAHILTAPAQNALDGSTKDTEAERRVYMCVEISPIKSEVLIEVVQPRSEANVVRKQSSQAGKRRKGIGRNWGEKKGSHRGGDERDKETQVGGGDGSRSSISHYKPGTLNPRSRNQMHCSHHVPIMFPSKSLPRTMHRQY